MSPLVPARRTDFVVRDELRQKKQRTSVSRDAMIADLNPYIRGARQYFRRVRRRTLGKLDRFVDVRLARWWARKHNARRPGYGELGSTPLGGRHFLRDVRPKKPALRV